MSDLTPFVEWGGAAWAAQVDRGLEWLGDVTGLRILEIGARYGGMATLLALRGAVVTALDINSDAFEVASETSERHGVGDRVRYEVYSGEPRDLPTGFDVVFSKSTLVLMPDLEAATRGIAASLVGGGRLMAVENARGPLPVHIARVIRRRSLHPHGANYFTRPSIDTISSHLRIDLLHWTAVPPTVVVGAVKD